jgi:hypothetical protein
LDFGEANNDELVVLTYTKNIKRNGHFEELACQAADS